MKRVVAVLGLAALVAAACAGCGGSTPSPSASVEAEIADDILTYSCGIFPFGPELMTAQVRHDEDAADAIAAALRAHLIKPGPDIGFLPDVGWTLAGQDGRNAEFVTLVDDARLVSVSLTNEGGGWRVTGWGDCQPQIVLAGGLGQASWVWAEGEPPVADSTIFDVLVTERACASGQPSVGRVVGPELVMDSERVLVIFAVRPQAGDFFTCPGNPATQAIVELPEPLGNRVLLDGGQLPFGDPLDPNR